MVLAIILLQKELIARSQDFRHSFNRGQALQKLILSLYVSM